MQDILRIKNLSKVYHDKNSETIAIKDLNLELHDKEILAIVGPSG